MAYLLVVSDFHLGAGAWLPSGRANLLEDFFLDEKFVESLDYYCSDSYRREDVTLVLNGDFLNFLQVQDATPDEFTTISEESALRRLNKIFEGHKFLFDGLRDFASTTNHRIVYVEGNHDSVVIFPKVRQAIKDRIGAEVHFPGLIYQVDSEVYIEHGHRFDVNNYTENTQEEVLAGKISIPWGSRFIVYVLTQLKSERPFIDKVVPLKNYVRWALFNDIRFIMKAGFVSARFFLSKKFDPTSRFPSIRGLLNLFRTPNSYNDLEPRAHEILEQGLAKIVVFGHTHGFIIRQVDYQKYYLNTGTWNVCTGMSIENLGRHLDLTYAFLEKHHEKWVPKLLEWKGAQHEIAKVIVPT